MASMLEQRLIEFIGQFRALQQEKRSLERSLGDRDQRLVNLSSECETLKSRLAVSNESHAELERLQEERALIQKRLDEALTRLEQLEKELRA